jgi:hypothetical protein
MKLTPTSLIALAAYMLHMHLSAWWLILLLAIIVEFAPENPKKQ